MRHQAGTVDSKHVDIERELDEAIERMEDEWNNKGANKKSRKCLLLAGFGTRRLTACLALS
jgi:hypothetical protein